MLDTSDYWDLTQYIFFKLMSDHYTEQIRENISGNLAFFPEFSQWENFRKNTKKIP